MRDARSARGWCTTGSNVTEPGRKSSARFRPALSRIRAWISGSGSVRARSGRGPRRRSRAPASPAPRDLSGHQLRDQRARALAGAAKLQHVHAVVGRLDDGGKRTAFAKRCDVAGHGHRPRIARTAQLLPRITDRRRRRGSDLRAGRGPQWSSRDADHADLVSTGRGSARITRISRITLQQGRSQGAPAASVDHVDASR